MDYTKFILERGNLLWDIRMKCMKEMYERAQPSANYDDIYAYYEQCNEQHITPDKIYNRHYLSKEEFDYILNKYVSEYKLSNDFKRDCDIIIRDMEEGCSKDKYIPEWTDEFGTHPGYRGYEKVPPLKETIGDENAQKVIDFIKMRKEFYRFNREEEGFRFDIALTDSPTSNEKTVIEYWKSQGKDIEIDPRHKDENYFWEEEHGYLEDDGE